MIKRIVSLAAIVAAFTLTGLQAQAQSSSKEREPDAPTAKAGQSQRFNAAEFAKAKADGTQRLTGDMTIRGISKSLGFAATVKIEGDTLRSTAKLAFDRAQHDVKFHSGTVAKLGDKLIYDNVPLEVELVATAR